MILQEIGRRCNTLISLITKETEVEEKEPHEDRRRRGVIYYFFNFFLVYLYLLNNSINF